MTEHQFDAPQFYFGVGHFAYRDPRKSNVATAHPTSAKNIKRAGYSFSPNTTNWFTEYQRNS